MSTLSKQEIEEYLKLPLTDKKRLVISPLLEESQITHDSVDVRLGTIFIIYKRVFSPALDVSEKLEGEFNIHDFQQKIHVPFGKPLIVPPNTFILGSTYEYLKIPPFLSCEVVNRSSWGRLGLITATAIWVHPYFSGCLTLELANLGDVNIAIFPGMPIAQLIFHKISEPPTYDQSNFWQGKYIASTEPRFSKIQQEKAKLDWIGKIGSKFHP